jgi:hypothetical protein
MQFVLILTSRMHYVDSISEDINFTDGTPEPCFRFTSSLAADGLTFFNTATSSANGDAFPTDDVQGVNNIKDPNMIPLPASLPFLSLGIVLPGGIATRRAGAAFC